MCKGTDSQCVKTVSNVRDSMNSWLVLQEFDDENEAGSIAGRSHKDSSFMKRSSNR